EADEELGVRNVAARDAAGLLLVQALGELDPLLDVRAARVQRAHGARELAHLEEELHGERAERVSRPSAMRSQSGWRPKARPASIIVRRFSTNAPPPGMDPVYSAVRDPFNQRIGLAAAGGVGKERGP